jgi:hypothetical protein
MLAAIELKMKKKHRSKNGCLVLWTILIPILCVVFHFKIEDVFVRRYGICAKAKVSPEERYSRGPDTFYFKFSVDGREYDGNSFISIRDKGAIGSEICIVYLPIWPEINRSIDGYFESNFKSCKCD